MSNTRISSKLAAAGLFGIAYGIDTSQSDYDATLQLFHFCAICLEEAGFDPHELLDDLDDGTDLYAATIERTQLIMGAVECLSKTEHGVPEMDTTVFAQCVEKMINLQLAFAGCHTELSIKDTLEGALSPPFTKQ